MELAHDPLRDASAPLPGLAVPPPNRADYWDLSVPNGGNAAQQPDQEFTGLEEVDTSGRQKALAGALLLILGVVAGFAGWLYFVEGVDPIDYVAELITGESSAVDDFEAPPPRRKAVAPAPVADAEPAGPARKPVAGNPYWHLPNAILGYQEAPDRLWTAEEEENWRAGLAHRYPYQRWKTVMEVRAQKLRGSEAILWDAMGDAKFWTRMYAAVGLAEFGRPVALQSIDAALANARSELVADFFERFVKKCTPGQCYMLRQAIRLLDEKGRIVALQGIARSKDGLRDLYLTAATQDPGKRVQRWIRRYLAERPLDPDKYNELLAVVAGKTSGEHLAGGAPQRRGATKPAFAVESDADLDKELTSLDEAGELEIYEPEAAVTDETDAETFEYDE